MKEIILSSTSPARKALLERLSLPFKVVAPDIDEGQLPGETPQQLVKRLAVAKAKIHSDKFANALIIGSDQVAVIENEIVGKPLTHENAIKILTKASGQKIIFYTGLCLFNTKTHKKQYTVEKYGVIYKKLSQEMIENYLIREKPYQCAGSIKVEGLGIALIKKLTGNDPSTLTGLPLIALIRMLENEGVKIL